jgi:GTP-binding protein Era
MKSGFVSVTGRPNVGKSSLINKIVGQKVSIVSPKSQTTRNKIAGILTTGEFQMILLDTPGMLRAKSELEKYMQKSIASAGDGTDVSLIVLDASRRLHDDEVKLIERHLVNTAPVFIALNKIDEAGFDKTYPLLSSLSYLTLPAKDRRAVKEIVPVSAKTGENVEKLIGFLSGALPEGGLYYPDDEPTDKSVRFMVSEIVREKALLFLNEEIPHGVGVMIQSMHEGKNLVSIEADLVVEKDSHKQIVIGAGGKKLGDIGRASRAEIEKLVDNKVLLKLFVKVRENWRNKKSVLNEIGYDKKDL